MPEPDLTTPAVPIDDLWTSDSATAAAQAETAEAPVSDVSPDPAAAVSAEPEPSQSRDEAGQFKPRTGKPRNDPRARVEAATAKEAAAKEDARIAREEASALKARLDAMEAAQSRPAPTKAPVIEQFPAYDAWIADHPDGDFDAWMDARTDWRTERRWQSLQQEQQTRARHESYNARLQAAKSADPEWDSRIAAADAVIGPGLQAAGLQGWPKVIDQAVLESQNGPEIVRYFSTHPDVAIQLAVDAKDVPATAVPVMRRYLESLVAGGAVARPDSASPAVRPSSAKPPINRVGGTVTATPVDPEDLEFGPEYIRRENAREKKDREAQRW